MDSRDRIRTIVAGGVPDRCGFWMGDPCPESWRHLHALFGTASNEEVRRRLHDDVRWVRACEICRHAAGKPLFDYPRREAGLGSAGLFADCESAREVEAFEWPDPGHLDLDPVVAALDAAGDAYCAGGFPSDFFQDVLGFFGRDEYILKLHTHPDLVHAVTRHVVDFYIEANHALFERAGSRINGFTLAAGIATAEGLLISSDAFREFVYPYLQELVELGRAHGHQVIVYARGSISKIIPDLIRMGVQAVAPIQTLATRMDVISLSRCFRGSIAFIGGVDTEDFLIRASPEQVRSGIRNLQKFLGPHYVVGPDDIHVSAEVPAANLQAMSEAVTA